MALDRLQRIASLWNWLPGFRAVAEYESIQRAALATSVSPSALSRTVKLLEDALGFDVFERTSTGLRLTEKGQALLEATRDAMRRVDDAVGLAHAETARVGAVPPFLPAIAARALGGLPAVASITSLAPEDVTSALLRGDVDLVICHQPEEHGQLEGQPLRDLAMVEARRPGSPAGAASTVRLDDLSAMLAVAMSSGCPVVVPRVLAPAGLELVPVAEATPVFAIWRRPISGIRSKVLDSLLEALERGC